VTDLVTPKVASSKRLPRDTTTAPSTRPADSGAAVVAEATGSPAGGASSSAGCNRIGVTVVRADQHTDIVSMSLHHGGGHRATVSGRWTARTPEIGPPRVTDPVESGPDACGLPDPAPTNGTAGGTEHGRATAWGSVPDTRERSARHPQRTRPGESGAGQATPPPLSSRTRKVHLPQSRHGRHNPHHPRSEAPSTALPHF